MNFKEIFRTALRSLRINPMRAMLSIIGVIFGIASVIILIAMGQGVRNQITKEIKDLGTNLLVIRSGEPTSGTESVTATQIQMASQPNLRSSTITMQDLETARSTDHVAGAYPLIQMAYEIEAEGRKEELRTTYTLVKGTDESYSNMSKVKVACGRFLGSNKDGDEDNPGEREAERSECVLGTLVSSILFDSVEHDVLGSIVTIKYTDTSSIEAGNPDMSTTKRMDFEVVGVMEERKKTILNDPNLEIYIPIEDAQILAGGTEGSILEITAIVDSEENVGSVQKELENAIYENHKENDPNLKSADFNIQNQEDLMGTYQYIFNILNALVFGVATISLITGGVGVANIMYVSVKERTKEIGVRLAQGASKKMIIMQFLIESILLCLIGALIGIPLGLIASLLINLSVLPASPSISGVLAAFLAAFVVGVLAGVFPARHATGVEITEALRAEF